MADITTNVAPKGMDDDAEDADSGATVEVLEEPLGEPEGLGEGPSGDETSTANFWPCSQCLPTVQMK